MLACMTENKLNPRKAEFRPHVSLQAFPFQQFHVLFNSLSKVLFIFPSRYLFAIGLSPIFSFRWNLPPILSCIPKQLDSSRAQHNALGVHVKDGILTLYDALFQETCTWSSTDDASLDYNSDRIHCQILNLSSSRFTRRY